MLLDFLPQVRERVQALLDGQHDDEILDLVHKLHGSCSYSGVPRLKQLCFYLERQLRQGITNDELEPEWLELLDEIELVIHAARASGATRLNPQAITQKGTPQRAFVFNA